MDVKTEIMSIEDAKKSGAMALFGEKYADEVRVVHMGDFSTELCGGTHVTNTSKIGMFKIVSETGIAAGVRRIEALTGFGVLSYYQTVENSLSQVSELLKTSNKEVVNKVEHLLTDIKSMQSENESLKSKLAKEALGDISNDVEQINGLSIIAQEVSDVDMNGLRELGDQLKDSYENSVILLASSKGEKVNLLVMASKNANDKGVHAGKIVKQIAPLVGGGGGGRENTAQAGGTNAAGIMSAFAKAKEMIQEQIS
jgi:alanyl-tRNA synthetase